MVRRDAMTLYLDVIWFLNFCIDYLLIALTAIVLKRRFNRIRFIVGALFASLIVFLMFTPLGALFYQPWMKAIYSIFIVLIAFGFKRWSYFFQGLLMFYFVTFMTGGGLFALHFFWQTEIDFLAAVSSPAQAGFGSGVSWVFVVLGFPIVWYFSKARLETIEVKKIHYEQLATVTIHLFDQSIKTQGLIDSGNKLHDPITRAPVMIIETTCLEKIFGQEVISAISTLDVFNDSDSELSDEWMKRTKIIPYKVIGQSSPFLTAIKPDSVSIEHDGQVYQSNQVLIGLQEESLSPDQAYQCIVHPALVRQPSISPVAN
jgi:stage II sporulation protein GA (sporulation sigma-E factor processing peptidase)